MNHEASYIKRCKSRIEEKLNWPDSSEWRQRDFLNLSVLIQSKTGVALSLSTLKRIWKPYYEGSPHPATLEAFAQFLGCNNWMEFKAKNPSSPDQESNASGKKLDLSTSVRKVIIPLSFLIIFAVVAIVLFQSNKAQRIAAKVVFNPDDVAFSCNNTAFSGVPNTVLFRYDVSKVEADSFFIQQSWNKFRRDMIQKEASELTSIYYYPGFHKAKLVANDSVVKETDVRINTDGWLSLVRYGYMDDMPVYIRNNDVVKNGILQVSADHLAHNKVGINRSTMVSYYYIDEFSGLSSTDFVFETRVRCDSIVNNPCPHIGISILGELDMHFIPLTISGCVGHANLKFGAVTKSGENNDLSSLGVDVYDWQELKIIIRDDGTKIYLNDRQAFQLPVREDIGAIVGFNLNFSGSGSVDYLKMSTATDQQLVYTTSFD